MVTNAEELEYFGKNEVNNNGILSIQNIIKILMDSKAD